MVFMTILLGLVPSFCMVILGGLVRERLTVIAWQGLDKLNFEILFPALLFVAASSRPIPLYHVYVIAPAVWTVLTAGLLLGWLSRRYGPAKFLDFAGAWQNAWRFNTALGFVVVAAVPGAETALFAVAIGMAVPVANVFAVTALSRGGNLGFARTVRKVALNPFLLASIGGVIVGLSGLMIPEPLMAPLRMLSHAAIPIALISIGATMKWGALARLDRFSGVITATKLMILPALVTAVGMIGGISGPTITVLVLFSALPTASGAHVLASGFGADRELAATLIAQSTLLSAVTLPIWIAVVGLLF